MKETTGTSLTLKGLKNNKDYAYIVRYTLEDGTVSSDTESFKFSIKVSFKPEVSVTARKDSATLKWKKIEGAEKYEVYIIKDGKAKKLITTKKLSVNIKNLSSGKEYSVIVRAYIGGKWTVMNTSDAVTFKTK